jgi:hypothetical protein
MLKTLKCLIAAWCLIAIESVPSAASEPALIIELWKGAAPGEKGDIGEERTDQPKDPNEPVASKSVVAVRNVSKPTIAIYRPPRLKILARR